MGVPMCDLEVFHFLSEFHFLHDTFIRLKFVKLCEIHILHGIAEYNFYYIVTPLKGWGLEYLDWILDGLDCEVGYGLDISP